MATAAMADDLTLVASSRSELQAIANTASQWFEMVGIRVNTAKTVLVHIPGQDERPVLDLEWQVAGTCNRITAVGDANSPVRLLGQYFNTSGKHQSLVKAAREKICAITERVGRKILTDRIGQMFVRMVLLPVAAYYLQGIPATDAELQSVASPILLFLKHTFGLPGSFPTAYLHSRKGGKVPRLQAIMETRHMELTVHLLNGKGSPEFAKVGQELQLLARRVTQFPGMLMKHPEQVPDGWVIRMAFKNNLWPVYMARILDKRGLNIRDLPKVNATDNSILDFINIKLGKQMLEEMGKLVQGTQQADTVQRAFRLKPVTGAVEVVPGPTRHWRGKLKGHVRVSQNILRRPLGMEAATPPVDIVRIWQLLQPGTWTPMNCPFLPDMIKSRYLTACMAAALQVYHHIAVHTDGSLVTTDVPQPSMGFGGMFQCTTIPFVSEFYSFSGATFDGPVSSTMAEFLALVVVAVLVPDRKCATVFCDSQAAIGLMNQVLDNHPNHQWERSNLAYIASWAVSWLKSKQLNLDLHWVKGHAGNLGNEEADRLAGVAHQSRNPQWSLQLGLPPGLLHWVCVDRQPSQKCTGRLIREQEESWMAERLLAQIKLAHPGADMCKESLQLTLEAVNWFDDGNSHYQWKNTHITTTSYDSNVCLMMLGIM
ncbi:hypothetical protein IW139_002384, partial [Coemansia sp. RSA 353]